jgi:hypothetical protein
MIKTLGFLSLVSSNLRNSIVNSLENISMPSWFSELFTSDTENSLRRKFAIIIGTAALTYSLFEMRVFYPKFRMRDSLKFLSSLFRFAL